MSAMAYGGKLIFFIFEKMQNFGQVGQGNTSESHGHIKMRYSSWVRSITRIKIIDKVGFASGAEFLPNNALMTVTEQIVW